jgi:hypothetical protein
MGRKLVTAFEAQALEELLDGRNHADFARQHKVPGGASMVSQHIKQRRPVNLEAALVYAEALRVPLGRISPRWAAFGRRVAAALQDDQKSTTAGCAPVVHLAEREPASFGTEWPFRQISAHQWARLTPTQQALIESTALQFLQIEETADVRAAV